MKIHLTNGLEAEIDETEAKRISEEVAKLHGAVESNETFMNRAAENIRALTGEKPKTEDEAKMILYKNLKGPSKDEIELLYETMEYIVGMHSAKTKSM